jgi:hypothetical protein
VGGALFFDVGGATDENLGRLFSDRLYPDAGVGFRIAFPRSTGSQVLRIDLAFPMRDSPDGSGIQLRVSVGGGQAFDSRLPSETVGAENANELVGFGNN